MGNPSKGTYSLSSITQEAHYHYICFLMQAHDELRQFRQIFFLESQVSSKAHYESSRILQHHWNARDYAPMHKYLY